MAIIDFKKNKPLTAREIKKRVMTATGWTSEQYQKQYDILRNKTRNYEQVTGSKTKIKVNELLYQQTHAQKRYGETYKPSRLVRAIMATPSASTGTVQRKGVSTATTERLEREILGEFRGFTSRSAEGAEIQRTYELQKSGYYKAEGERLAEELKNLTQTRKDLKKAIKTAEGEAREELEKQLKEANEAREKFAKDIEALRAEELTAPRTIAELKQQLTSAAKSLREYQKNARGEWKRKNPDAPADYIVGTP